MTPKDVENTSGSDENGMTSSPESERDAVDLDQLGRQRPAVFPNFVYEVLFCSSLLVSMFMAVRYAD